MDLFFLRHGEAERYAASDAERCLTIAGEGDVAKVIESRRAELADVDLIVTSPYKRARQTAKIAAQGLSFDRQLLITEQLEPSCEPRSLLFFIDSLDARSVLFITHQPLIGNVLSLLSGDNIWLTTGTANLVALKTEVLVPGFADVCWSEAPRA